SSGIEKYEVVHVNDLAYVGVEESMRLLLDFGMENVEKKIKEIDEYLINRLLDYGYNIQTPLGEGEHHAIVNFRVKNPDKLMEFLLRNGVVASKRVGGIRVSPHFYNTKEEIDRFIEILKSAE
ncbi:MAG: aminotransferase class V-fold PLP-dependent enzyme, partial [Candidatus Bathyarchaeia archaeon]